MIQVDLPAAFTLGQIFAMLSKKYLKKTPEKFTNKLLGPFNIYISCGFLPGAMYLLVGWPAWEAMYVTGWVEKTYNKPFVAGFYVLFMASLILLGNIGYILGHYCYLKGKDKLVIYGSIIGAVLTLIPFILRWGVWWEIGTYAQIQANKGYSFFKNPFFGGWLFVMCYVTVATLLIGLWFKKKGSML